jgi:hypothetical protein
VTFTITPRVVRPGAIAFRDFDSPLTGLEGKGFKAGETVEVRIAGVLHATVTVDSLGRWTIPPTTKLKAVPFGVQTITASSPSATATHTLTVLARVPEPMVPDFAAPGDTIAFPAGKIRGLKAGTAYQITLGAHTGAPVLKEFTSDATGSSPAVSFTIPAAITEWHIIDVREKATGISAIYGNLLTTPTGGEYTNLFIFVRTKLTLSPDRGGVGTEFSITADKLRAGKDYTFNLLRDATLIETLTFTATAAGTIPTGTTIKLREMASTEELGTRLTARLETSVDGVPMVVGTATFTFFATATLDKTEALPGDLITITARGLVADELYRVHIDFVSPANPGVLVGTLSSDPFGSGSASFIVPDGLPTGPRKVQLVRTVAGVDSPKLLSPPSFTIKAAVALFDSATFKATAKTDKPSYRVGEEFKVSFLLKTTTGAARFDYVVTVKDPDGRVLYPISAATGISVDTIGTTITVTYAVPTGAKAGTWTASIVILQAGAVVDVAVITFTVT